MSKKTTKKVAPKVAKDTTPAGYESRNVSDIEGFWDGESAIHFIPRGYSLSDSKIESRRTSVLILGELVDSLPLTTKDGEVEGRPGFTVGIWGKPGMRALLKLCGVPVYMYPNGEKDVGKKLPMKLYEVKSKSVGTALPLTSDFRRNSINDVTWTERQRPQSVIDDGLNDDNVPF